MKVKKKLRDCRKLKRASLISRRRFICNRLSILIKRPKNKRRRRKLCFKSLRTKNLKPILILVKQSLSMSQKSVIYRKSLKSNLSNFMR